VDDGHRSRIRDRDGQRDGPEQHPGDPGGTARSDSGEQCVLGRHPYRGGGPLVDRAGVDGQAGPTGCHVGADPVQQSLALLPDLELHVVRQAFVVRVPGVLRQDIAVDQSQQRMPADGLVRRPGGRGHGGLRLVDPGNDHAAGRMVPGAAAHRARGRAG
jgi:hypothetical protein